jgi:hypothetical protein
VLGIAVMLTFGVHGFVKVDVFKARAETLSAIKKAQSAEKSSLKVFMGIIVFNGLINKTFIMNQRLPEAKNYFVKARHLK